MTSACSSCHRIAGTPAQADVGPDLSHLASRATLAAGTIPDTWSELAAWIHNPQAIRAGRPDAGPRAVAQRGVVAGGLPGDADVVRTTAASPEERHTERLERIWAERPGVLGWLTTTDRERIGILYFFTALAFFGAGRVEALLIRTQLIDPNHHLLSPQAYNELFTMHGITMIFLFVIPMTTGAFGNYLIPLMIGARNIAFPRMNAFSYWVGLASGIFMYVALAQGHAPNAGWFDYVPLASEQVDPGNNMDFYSGYRSDLPRDPRVPPRRYQFHGRDLQAACAGHVDQPDAVVLLRVPGGRVRAAVRAALAERRRRLFLELDPAASVSTSMTSRMAAIRWYGKNLFWIFGHPEVYVVVLPAFGIATSIIPAFVHPPDGAVPARGAVRRPRSLPGLRRLGPSRVHGRIVELDDGLLRRREPDNSDPVGDSSCSPGSPRS